MIRFQVRAAVYVLFEKKGKILMFRRKNTDWFDGYFNVPCGHIDGGESMPYAAAREAREEVGVTVSPKDLKLIQTAHRYNGKYEYLETYFLAKKWKGEPRLNEEELSEELSWFEMESLPENTIPYIREAILSYLSGHNYCEYNFKDGKPVEIGYTAPN
ncbi:MAG: NUDIX domain-containing protein [Candidatus Berkelbacteria bacterium]